MNWDYRQHVNIIFGSGRISELPEHCSTAARPLIISTPHFKKNGFAQKLAGRIGAELFTDLSPDPDVEEVNECSRRIREHSADLLIALGGGSAIDLAKAASVATEDITAYHGTGKAVPREHLPLIAVPTTAGSGSEISNVSVLTNRKTGEKLPIASDSFYPQTAIVDPELTLSVPPKVTAQTGIDVLCHAIESYWSRKHQPICDALAVHAARLVFEYLPLVFRSPDEISGREKMAEASVTAGLAFAHSKTTSSHACSYPLTAIYHIPHGEACGLTLDYFARLNAVDPRTAKLASELGFRDPADMADRIFRLKKELGLRTDLREFGLSDQAVNELVAKSHHPNLYNNPIEVTDKHLHDLYNEMR